MRKCLLFVALIIVSQLNVLRAQPLFTAPDTVCPKQAVQLLSNVPDAKSHYWGFCSGYIFNSPVATALGKNNIDAPMAVEVEKDGDNFYAFVLNRGNAGSQGSFIRLEFGKSLDNTPKITSYGTMDNVLPVDPTAMNIVKDDATGNWYIFVVGGLTQATSSLARVDFGKTLANTPNVVNFGNLNSTLNVPVGMFVTKEDKNWYGFTFNKSTNDLVRIEFDSSISLTPTYANLGAPTGISQPNDYAAITHNGVWYFFVTNTTGDTLVRLDMGAKLATTVPVPNKLGNLNDNLSNPTGIAIVRDCDSFHMFITNRGSNKFIRVDMTSITGPYLPTNFGNLGTLVGPTGLSRAIRDRDNVYLLSTNDVDSNLVKIKFQQCSNASIQSSTTYKPPVYSYNAPGTYNLYYMVNEGLPDAKVQCKIITVLPTPEIFMSNDTTICQGDTIPLRLISVTAINKTWSPNYNISNTTKDDVRVYPEYSTNYHITLPYNSGCIVDTVIKVTVFSVTADAGPDRTLENGATTLLGGPLTSEANNFSYLWTPDRFLNSNNVKNPVATPPYDFAYYLTVRDKNSGCVAVDTVTIRVGCEEVNLANAFLPNGNSSVNRFGLKNTQIVKLSYFRIYDRWGKLVFETTDPTQEWDGKINGDNAGVGVYVWSVDGFCISGKRLKAGGNVTLIR